ncbi:hypothetical protein BKA80DRAFT_23152 [Phyllosticta citrichinensis]
MPEKRPREDTESTGPAKKTKHGAERRSKGFQVGPANLPDGTHRRKVQQIKKDLIHKAKIKKEYAKIKERELANQPKKPQPVDDTDQAHQAASAPEPSLDPHPDRQALVDSKEPEPQDDQPAHERRKRKPKPTPFAKEAAVAQKRKEEAEARQKAREEAEKQRQQRIDDRERMRRAMAKAHKPGRDGKRKLGREAPVLLEKVKRMVNNS